MKASELRVSNFIGWYEPNQELLPVKVIGLASKTIRASVNGTMQQHNEIYQSWKPIQLTEEWLLNFGAKEILPKRGVFKEFVLKTVRLEMSHNGNFYYKNSKLILEYVHQLQNLYFALKNEELTFKSE